ncbi:hypothetical protein [Spirosoma sp.]|uniref:hypothetical protein n=1 Tax=Spirosoma sp. TaxID=1899569 RepID=UPI002624D47A|nr:hypothetical protein [Spirosoma sp.]MCX6214660.1 hypothetical protein [Spirosoma sp.]
MLSGKRKAGYSTCPKDICNELNGSNLADLPNTPNTRIRGVGPYSLIKFRIADSGNKRGQSGGFRVYALTNITTEEIILLLVYPKNGKKKIESITDAYEKELVKEFIRERDQGLLVKLDLQHDLAAIEETQPIFRG